MGLILKNRRKNEEVPEKKVKVGIQGPDSNKPANERLNSISLGEPVGLSRQDQDVALEEYEAESSFDQAALDRAIQLLALWARRHVETLQKRPHKGCRQDVTVANSNDYSHRKMED